MNREAVVIDPEDNVATATVELAKDQKVTMLAGDLALEIVARDDIPFGHKIAVKDIAKGEHVIKYGEPIGRAVRDIAAGEHVHVHNVESERGRGDRR